MKTLELFARTPALANKSCMTHICKGGCRCHSEQNGSFLPLQFDRVGAGETWREFERTRNLQSAPDQARSVTLGHCGGAGFGRKQPSRFQAAKIKSGHPPAAE